MSYIDGVDRNQIVLFPGKTDDYIREDNDNRESSVNAVKSEELKGKIQWLKGKGEEYRALLKKLVESGGVKYP